MADPDLEAFLAPLRDKPWLDVNSPPSNFVGISEAELLYRLREYRESAVAAAKAQIVGWLREQERRWRHSSSGLGSSNAADVAAHYAQALHNAAASIESGAPERWAAEREGSR